MSKYNSKMPPVFFPGMLQTLLRLAAGWGGWDTAVLPCPPHACKPRSHPGTREQGGAAGPHSEAGPALLSAESRFGTQSRPVPHGPATPSTEPARTLSHAACKQTAELPSFRVLLFLSTRGD